MSEQLRFIVDKLNKEPYNKSYTIITFDSLDSLNLMQVLNDVIAEIDPEQKVDLRDEPPEQTALRLLSTLRLFNYKPKSDAGEGMNMFRQGLIKGEKATIYPLIAWLLERAPDLKKRAYLARYLVKIDVPLEFLQDEVVEETYQTYQSMMEHFKELHKAVEMERSSEYNTADVRQDIESMEEEKKQLERQLERLRRRVESFPNHEEMLDSAQKLRKERAKGLQLKKQKGDQKEQLVHVQQKLQRMSQELDEIRNTTVGLTAEAVISKIEEENKVQKMIAGESLPKKVETKRKQCIELEKVLSEPVVSELDLEVIQQQIDEVNEEIRILMEKKMAEDETGQENMTMFRQQASIIAHKRQTAAETVQALMDEVNELEKELELKQKQLDDLGGIELVREDEFRKYIDRLRVISNTYKMKKAELSAFRAEYGVLSRTEEIIKSRDENAQGLLEFMEKRQGVSGFRSTQDNLEKVSNVKSELDSKKEETLKDMSRNVEQLKRVIEDKKAVLAPLIREVRPLRQQHQEIKNTHTEKKSAYDSLAAGLQSNRAQLERQVKSLWEECMAEESQYHLLNCQLESVRLHDQRVKAEMKIMVSKDPAEKKKSMRDVLTRKIQEQENRGRALRDKQKDIKDTHEFSMKQVKMWKDLYRLFQVKQECLQRAQEQRLQAKALDEMATDGRIEINN